MFSTYQRLNLHVSANARDVIRAARGKLTKRALKRECRTARHEFLRQMLAHHANWQETCRTWRM